MKSLFINKNISPMLLHKTKAFNSEDYIYEFKFDGCRCIAYLEKDRTILKNKRNKDISANFPELLNIHANIKKPCILDGELVIIKNGNTDFASLQKRALQANQLKINIASKRMPSNFIAYDILQIDDKVLIDVPLIRRKKILEDNLIENERINYSRYITTDGKALFEVAKNNNLEGIIAKRKDSTYFLGKRTKYWLKIKVMQEDIVYICGYINIVNGGIDLVLGTLKDNKFIFIGTLYGIPKTDREKIIDFAKKYPENELFTVNKQNVIWMKPALKIKVRYMLKTDKGKMRQPIYVGLSGEDDI